MIEILIEKFQPEMGSSVIDAISIPEKPNIFRVGDKNEFTFRAVAAPNGDIFTLSRIGIIPRTLLTHFTQKVRVKRIEIPIPNPNITINKNGDIIIADPTVLIFINKDYKMSPIFQTHEAFRDIVLNRPAWHVSALTTNDQNEIIMVIVYQSGKRYFAHFTSNGTFINVHSINNNDPAKYASIAAIDNILLGGTNGIDVYDKNFIFIETLIYEKNVFFIIDTFDNIATVGNKEVKGYSPNGKLLVQKPFNIRNIYDVQPYPDNCLLILYSQEPWGVSIIPKVIII